MPAKEIIYGINPVMVALEECAAIEKIYIQEGLKSERLADLSAKARPLRIPLRRVPAARLRQLCRKQHQGVIATLTPIVFHRLGSLIPSLYEKALVPLIIVLEKVTDVGNFGAIVRTAEAAGAHGVVITIDGSARMGGDAVKASAGALLRMPICREYRIHETVAFLKQHGIKVIACSESGEMPLSAHKLSDPLALVLGSEGTGISPQVLSACDGLGALPMMGKTGSYNVSVAAGMAMYEVMRQRL